jgi:hypothetical protein
VEIDFACKKGPNILNSTSLMNAENIPRSLLEIEQEKHGNSAWNEKLRLLHSSMFRSTNEIEIPCD